MQFSVSARPRRRPGRGLGRGPGGAARYNELSQPKANLCNVVAHVNTQRTLRNYAHYGQKKDFCVSAGMYVVLSLTSRKAMCIPSSHNISTVSSHVMGYQWCVRATAPATRVVLCRLCRCFPRPGSGPRAGQPVQFPVSIGPIPRRLRGASRYNESCFRTWHRMRRAGCAGWSALHRGPTSRQAHLSRI